MASIDLIRACLDSIRQISDQIADAAVYLDAGSLEAFQFIGAFPVLLELGARCVCSLENMSSLDITMDWNSTRTGPARKMVVITSRLLSDAHRYILRCLGTHQTIVECIIFTSISEIAHSAYVDSPLGPDAFGEYETLLLQDYEEIGKKCQQKGAGLHPCHKKKELTDVQNDRSSFVDDSWSRLASIEHSDNNVEVGSAGKDTVDEDSTVCTGERGGPKKLRVLVHHFPMLMCPISSRVYVFPSEGTVSEACLSNNREDSFSPGLPSICTGVTSDGEDVPPGATLTANFLYHLAAKMDLKLEIFSLGDTSKVIGKMLTDMSSLYDVGRRKRSAGLLIIDRTLDLLTPSSHGDSFLDCVLSSLPRRERAKSSLSAKISQSVNKDFPLNLQRPPLDVRIPLETIFRKEEPAMNSTQLSENIVAFVSGWNSTEAGHDTSDLVDLADKMHNDKLDVELGSLLSGSFLSNHAGKNYLQSLLDQRSKDGALLIKKWLLEALQHDNIPVNVKVRLGLTTASEIHTLIKKLAPDQISLVKNRGIIQLALGAEVVLGEPCSSHWDAFVSAERILNVSSVETSQSLSSQIRDFINTSILSRSNKQDKAMGSSNGLLSFKDALLLAMIGYILAGENIPTSGSTGPFSWEEEHHLKEAIVDAVLEKATTADLQFLHGLEKEFEAKSRTGESGKDDHAISEPSKIDDFDDQWGTWDDDDTDQQNDEAYDDMQFKLELRDRVDHLFKIFHRLSGLKWRHPALKDGLVASATNFGGDPYARKGLIYKLLTTVLAKYDIPGLEYHSSAVGRFLKSGFGRFGLGQAKPNFGDQNVLLIFVVGGINTLEVREAMEAVSESRKPDTELIFGGTTLLTPDDMYELLLGSSSYI